jgi:integrase
MFDATTPTTTPEGDEPRRPTATLEKKHKPLHPVIRGIKHRETGMGKQDYEEIKARNPNNPIQQIATFFGGFRIPAAIGRKRKASYRTQDDYQTRMNTFVRTLRELNMPVRNLDEISKKQVRLYFQHMEREGKSAVWMANINTAIRRFGIWIGKPELCPPLGELMHEPWSGKRRIAAQKDHTWGHDELAGVLEQVQDVCPMTSLHIRLASLFGHRVQEFLMFRPTDAVQGDYIHLKEGTKGGRTRMVPIETEEQRKWLNVAIDIAPNYPNGRLMAKEGMTLQQARNHFYNVLRICGVSKKNIGLTTHGLRHSYACQVYQDLTGEKAPIQGGAPIDQELDKRARLEIARRLGHGRVSVTTAYLGSHAALKKYARENLQRIEHLVKNDQPLQTLMKESEKAGGFDSLCLIGPIARGDTLDKKQSAVLAYAAKSMAGETQSQADDRVATKVMAICRALSATLGRLITPAPLSDIHDSDDRFELF